MDSEEEELSLKLIGKLEQLESENNRLHQTVHDNSQREFMLESKISALDAQLEDAKADIVNLEATGLSQTGRTRAHEIYENTLTSSTPKLLPQNQIYSSSPGSPMRPTVEQMSSSPSSNVSSPGRLKPWESGGIRTQISDFMARMEELEKENDSLKHINLQLQNLNVMRQSKGRNTHEIEELEVAKRKAEKRASEMGTDMAVLIAHQQTLLSTFEDKSSSLTKTTQEFEAYKAKRQMELREFEMRLSVVVGDFKKAEMGLRAADERRRGDEATIAQSQKLIVTMQKELGRKDEAIKQMRGHTEQISSNYKAMTHNFNLEQRNAKLLIGSLRAEGKEKDLQIAKLLGDTGDLLNLRQQKKDLQSHCHDLLSVVESQQEMIILLQSSNAQNNTPVPSTFETVTPKPKEVPVKAESTFKPVTKTSARAFAASRGAK